MEILPSLLPKLLGIAWLLPLASFVAIVFFGPRMGKAGKYAGYVATGAIILAFVCSAVAMTLWLWQYPPVAVHHATSEGGHGAEAQTEHHAKAEHPQPGHGEHAEAGPAEHGEAGHVTEDVAGAHTAAQSHSSHA